MAERDRRTNNISSNSSLPPSKSTELPLGCVCVTCRLKQLFDSAEAGIAHPDHMQMCLQHQSQSMEQMQEEQHIETVVKYAQERLIEGLTRQLQAKSHRLEALEAKLKRRDREYQYAEAAVTMAQQELGIKRGTIEELRSDTTSKQQKIEHLEREVHVYKGICSYVAAHTLNRDQQFGSNVSRSLFQPHRQPPVAVEGACPAPVATSSHALGFTASAALHTSLAEGAAGLLAMSTAAAAAAANKPDVLQGEAQQQQPLSGNTNLTKPTKDAHLQEVRSTAHPFRRATGFITDRHPGAPQQVQVQCRKLTGTLLLGDCYQRLKILVPSMGHKLVSPSEFEAEAGCGKGKNWKSNIKVIGTGRAHGSTQLLKVWLPGLVSLSGDHSTAAVAKHTNIASLLDAETGFRIQANDQFCVSMNIMI